MERERGRRTSRRRVTSPFHHHPDIHPRPPRRQTSAIRPVRVYVVQYGSTCTSCRPTNSDFPNLQDGSGASRLSPARPAPARAAVNFPPVFDGVQRADVTQPPVRSGSRATRRSNGYLSSSAPIYRALTGSGVRHVDLCNGAERTVITGAAYLGADRRRI
jgi:hypothetical protein